MPSWDFTDFHRKLFTLWAPSPSSDRPACLPQAHRPACLPQARTLWRALEVCVPIPWKHHLQPPGEWELSRLVRLAGLTLPERGPPVATQAEWRAFAACGRRPPVARVPAETWRAIVEAALDGWWRRAHGDIAKDLRFELALEHSLRGVPRVPRGTGAGELLEAPERGDAPPLEQRGVSREWVRAFLLWMVEQRAFRIPVSIFVECFVRLVTAPHGCALYDLVPPAHRCPPRTHTCHAGDDDLHAVLAANQQDPWLQFVATNLHAPDEAAPDSSRVAACVAACPEGVVLCLPGKGEPAAALRPLYRTRCVVEICCALARSGGGSVVAVTLPLGEVVAFQLQPSTASAAGNDEHGSTPINAPALLAPPRLRIAFGGVDDDVERHREIAEAIRALSSEASAAEDAQGDQGDQGDGAEMEMELKRALRDEHGGASAVDARLREMARKAFYAYYRAPRHEYVRKLYATG